MTSYFEKQIFITGANGQLGTALRKQYPGAQFADREDFDITDDVCRDCWKMNGGRK